MHGYEGRLVFLFPAVKCLVEEEMPDTGVEEDENLESYAAKLGNRGRTQRQGSCSQKTSTGPADRCDLVLLVL